MLCYIGFDAVIQGSMRTRAYHVLQRSNPLAEGRMPWADYVAWPTLPLGLIYTAAPVGTPMFRVSD